MMPEGCRLLVIEQTSAQVLRVNGSILGISNSHPILYVQADSIFRHQVYLFIYLFIYFYLLIIFIYYFY